MPTQTYAWQWEEAFQKFGFRDGDDPQHNKEVGDFLKDFGYSYHTSSGIHNGFICALAHNGVRVELPEDDEDVVDIRAMFPKDVLAALDKAFPWTPVG